MLCIVIPVFNRKKFTADCLQSLLNQTHRADFIIVVDDGSTDGTWEMLDAVFPEVIVLRGDGNLFWTAAINLGIRCALSLNPDYVMTLNNDTVASGDFIEKMLLGAKQYPKGLIGALG